MKEFFCAERLIYPSIFRMLMGLLLLFDLAFTFSSFDLIFDAATNAFLPQSPILNYLAEHYLYFISGYVVSLVFWIFGIGRNWSSLFVFIGYLLYFEMTFQLVTWGDIILKFTLMFFIFVDAFQYLSVHCSKPVKSWVSHLAVLSIILHLFLVYLTNAYFKFLDDSWQDGVGVFYSAAQYPNFRASTLYPVISNAFFGPLVNYFIMALQLLFVPLVLWRKTRKWMVLVLVLVHGLMIIQFGLWKFELIMWLLFGFVFEDREWRKFLPSKVLRKFFPEFTFK